VGLAVIIIYWLFTKAGAQYIWLYIAAMIWLVIYIFLLQVLTGIVVFMVTVFILMVYSMFYNRHIIYRWFVTVSLLTMVLLASSFLAHSYAKFFNIDKLNPATIDKYTAKGNSYYNDFTPKFVENGHYTFLYICDPELKVAWQLRSNLDYEGKTKDMGNLRLVLYRYLTSKGLRKDANGLGHLSNREIHYIESGVTNYIDTNKYSMYARIYRTIWELYNYKNGVNPSGYSVAQRVEYVKTAWHIINNHFWLGVGTGDIPDAFRQQYIIDKSKLVPEKRLRTHNQLITFWATFGMIGLLILLFSMIAPPIIEKRFSDYLFLTIFIITFVSFLNEDTLETHTGISFIAIFYTLFLFYDRDKA